MLQLSLLARKCDEEQALQVQIDIMESFSLAQCVWLDEFGFRKKPPQR